MTLHTECSSVSTNRTSLWMGRFHTAPVEVLMSTVLTSLSSPGYVFLTTPIGHLLRVVSSSLMRTTSPISKFLFSAVHFDLAWRSERYSFLHLSQNKLAMNCTALHRFLQYMSFFWNTPGGGRTTFDFMVGKEMVGCQR